MTAALANVNGEPLSPVLEAHQGDTPSSTDGAALEGAFGGAPDPLPPLMPSSPRTPSSHAANGVRGGGGNGPASNGGGATASGASEPPTPVQLPAPVVPCGIPASNGSAHAATPTCAGQPSPASTLSHQPWPREGSGGGGPFALGGTGDRVGGVGGAPIGGPPPLEREPSHGRVARQEWSLAEDELILEYVRNLGCKWRMIAAQLPGRSDDAVRNRWNRLRDPSFNSALKRELRDESNGSNIYRCSKCGQPKKNHRCTYVPPEIAGSDIAPLYSAVGPSSLPFDPATYGSYSYTPPPEVVGAAEGSLLPVPSASSKEPADRRLGWKKEEDEMITRSVTELGHKWFLIAERLPGRTDHAIRNRWHRLLTLRLDEMNMRRNGSSGDLAGGHRACDESAVAAAAATAGAESDVFSTEARALAESLDALTADLTSDPMNALELGDLCRAADEE